MKQWSSLFNDLARSFSGGGRKSRSEDAGREAAEAMVKEAKKNEMILCSSGSVNGESSKSFVSVFSRRGQKGVNQDCSIVWEVCFFLAYPSSTKLTIDLRFIPHQITTLCYSFLFLNLYPWC